MSRLGWFFVVIASVGTALFVDEVVTSGFARWSAGAVGATTIAMLFAVTHVKRRGAGWWGALCVPPVAVGMVLALAGQVLAFNEVVKLGPAVTPRDLAGAWNTAMLAGGLGLLGCLLVLAAGLWARPVRAAAAPGSRLALA